MALGGNFATHGIEAELTRLGAFAAVDAGVLPLFSHDNPHGLLEAKQAEHAAHRTEVVAPDPPDQEEFGQDDAPDEHQLKAHGSFVDEPGGLDRNNPRSREQAGQGKTVQQGNRQNHGQHRVTDQRTGGGRKKPPAPQPGAHRVGQLGQGILGADPAAKNPAKNQGETCRDKGRGQEGGVDGHGGKQGLDGDERVGEQEPADLHRIEAAAHRVDPTAVEQRHRHHTGEGKKLNSSAELGDLHPAPPGITVMAAESAGQTCSQIPQPTHFFSFTTGRSSLSMVIASLKSGQWS